MSVLSQLIEGLTISVHSDWLRFLERLNTSVQSGHIKQIKPMKRLLANDEEWYLDPSTGEVYVYAPPDWPMLPEWKKVDVFAHEQEKATDHRPQ